MAMFIDVKADNTVIAKTPGLAAKLVEVCPVKIYALGSEPNTVRVVEDNVDECTLCDQCLQQSPTGCSVTKLY
ncbi:MAG TPA: hypothetical protein VGK20_17995 [Candidatus Binatia bacterium]|jgi:NAD-dependent dihydropyrimidine dehydrogenase PreA subunit